MVRKVAIGMLAILAMGGAAEAQQAAYTWTGPGQGSGKCTSYKMTVTVTVVSAGDKILH